MCTHRPYVPSSIAGSTLPWLACLAILALFITPTLHARVLDPEDAGLPRVHRLAKTAEAFPVYETRLHYVGQVWVALSNWGLIGVEWSNRVSPKDREALQINYSPSFEFPGGTRNDYLYSGGLWIGGIVGPDTLVSLPVDGASRSSAGEFASYDTVTESSSLRGTDYYDPGAFAEQQYFVRYSDTLITGVADELDGRLHRPLNIEVSQTSYAWSDNFTRQFVIVENWIRNIGTRPIDKMVCGVFIDADVYNKRSSSVSSGWIDDVSGFIADAPGLLAPDFRDELNIAWVADNDGDPYGGQYPQTSARGQVGIRILRAPPSERFSFNWWLTGGTAAQDWGPVRAGERTPATGGGLGVPEGDRNRYYVMGNGEIDYGQLYAALDHTADGWRPPLRAGGCDIADGLDTREVISAGPFCDPLFPGDSIPFVYALCAGDNAYNNPDLQFDCYNPNEFARSVNGDQLAYAATWAAWIFDTPGVDTDGDGYSGEYHLVNCDGRRCDTVFYTGDLGPPPGPDSRCRDFGGAPDRAGPSAPPCPTQDVDMFAETHPGEVIVRWSGRNTETVPDPLSKKYDFEGYHLYVARFNAAGQYSLIASWDTDDYLRYSYQSRSGRWILQGNPVTIDSLRAMHGDDFDPNLYTVPSTGTCFRDSIIDAFGYKKERCSYFVPQDANNGNVYEENGTMVQNIIQRVGDSVYVTAYGDSLTYGLYEARLTSLNPSLGVYVSVTAFDFGEASLGLTPQESQIGGCNQYVIPISSADVVTEQKLGVSVYPNPYKVSWEDRDGKRTSYFQQGFEAPEKRGSPQGMDEQDRRIWFINLPANATIRIFTLDGDLIRTLHHEWPRPAGSGEAYLSDYSSRVGWDLITRNTQAITSGIYIYRVDSPVGTQFGKIVIIK